MPVIVMGLSAPAKWTSTSPKGPRQNDPGHREAAMASGWVRVGAVTQIHSGSRPQGLFRAYVLRPRRTFYKYTRSFVAGHFPARCRIA
jgi:hypothetical protein